MSLKSSCFLFTLITIAYSDKVSVFWNDSEGKYTVETDVLNKSAVAWAVFDNSINKTGWATLTVGTNKAFDNEKQAYAAGLVEGVISRDLISMHWANTYDGYCTTPLSGFCKKLQDYLDKNLAWVQKQITKDGKKDAYWQQVKLFLAQSSGLIDGYRDKISSKPTYSMDVTGLFMMQIAGDAEDLSEALGHPEHKRMPGVGHCSALIKLLPENKDLYVSQDTWNGYNSMLRVLKKYDFQFETIPGGKTVPGSTMTFSSYPGILMSGDDFYVINSGLVTQETTIGNANAKLWSKVKPERAVLEGIRNMVANRLATSGEEWATIFEKFNSGTYNNQWMIVDYNVFKPGLPLNKGLLYVVEQIPGMIVSNDMTNLLTIQKYWPSYNTPYFPAIFNASGCRENVEKYGDWFSYDKTPRALIFRRDHEKVKDTDSMIKLMRYNNYQNDPSSACKCSPPYSAENAISARSDLNPANGTYQFGALGHRPHGGTDMKMTTYSLAKSLDMIAVSSPTYDQVPPFQWSKSDFEKSVKHVGHPDLWTFKPIQTKFGIH